jgi:tetratricopeptide (TPR) repeat protein
MEEEAQRWTNAANGASNLSQIELVFGDIPAAVATAEKSVALADSASGTFWPMANRALHADALHSSGEHADAERRQRESEPKSPLLYSQQGYGYCDLLLSQGRAAEARDRAVRTIEVARRNNWVLNVALDTLTLGRAHLALTLQYWASAPSDETTRDNGRAAAARLDEAVEGLRASGTNDHLPRGLLARAAFRRSIGDWDGAWRDLAEAQEIAEPGPLRLYLCDCALGRARRALARHEAFAPLIVEPSPPPPALPDAAEAARLLKEARKELNAAGKLIADCGYHRRDAELAELDEVAVGRRRFADLPPRVCGCGASSLSARDDVETIPAPRRLAFGLS